MEDTKKLARPVTVAGVTYHPGDPIPAEALAKITNPKAWVALDENAEEPNPSGPAGTASGHRLAGTVTVGGKSYGPKDFIPDDVARKIRNPKAWEGGTLPDLSPATPAAAEPLAGEDGGDGGGDGGGPDDKPRGTKAAAKRG